MQYRTLGRSGLLISRVVLGTTMFGELMDLEQARAVVYRAWDLGLHTIDTADIYAGGRSEEMVGEIIGPRRDQVILCSKVGYRVGDAAAEHAASASGLLNTTERAVQGIAPHHQGHSRQHIVRALEQSLRRLRTDYIDYYQLHRWDPSVPADELLRSLEDLRRAGKIRYVGCSNLRGWQLYEQLRAADRTALEGPAGMQVPYSLLAPEAQDDALDACLRAQVGVIGYSSLAGGLLTGSHRGGVVPGTVLAQRPGYRERFLTQHNLQRLDAWHNLALSRGMDMTTLALAFVLSHPAMTAVTVGVQAPAELDALIAAFDHPLDSQARAHLFAGGNSTHPLA
jgi:aryl-alcohol dehydrogenase-like predicted oxidoreductase